MFREAQTYTKIIAAGNSHTCRPRVVQYFNASGLKLYTPYSAHNIMSPETAHKLMGLYMEILILDAILQYMVSASLSCFLHGV